MTQLDALTMLPLERNMFHESWFGIVVLALCVLYSMVVAMFWPFIVKGVQAMLGTRKSAAGANKGYQSLLVQLLLFLLAVLCIAYDVYFALQHFVGGLSPSALLVLLPLVLFVFLFADLVLLGISGCFFVRAEAMAFFKSCALLMSYSSLLLFPLTLAMLYGDPWLAVTSMYVALVCLAGMAIFYFCKFIQNLFINSASIFYLFLYLCIWKILPIWAVLKAVSESSLIVEF